MRTITYNAGAYLVEELMRAGVVRRFLHDGGDIILFETYAGSRVSVHLIESSIELYEIKSIVAGNEAQNVHTLFILWSDRLLPGEGWNVAPPDWMEALYTLYGDKIYAYDVYGNEIFIFPVYFEGYGGQRHVRYGTTVHIPYLQTGTANASFGGVWRVANFGGHTTPVRRTHPLQAYFDLLGVDEEDDADAVKKAYRLLARRYHPDINRSPDATEKMQQINEAYTRITALLDDSA